MRIQKLHINNIASIVDATIDFTAQPLCDTDVYLITGDTGAGKTTILDSICLALFNNTPRLSKGKSIKVLTDDDNLTLKDTRRLMRRNTVEALVELFFESKGHEYKAEWQAQRGVTKKISVSISNISRCLTDLTTKETITGTGTKDDELQAKIIEVIGLDFEQFCRTTMLAQNEFTKFLSSEESNRAEILEKITQTTEFSRAGAKIFEVTSQKKTKWEQAQQEANDTGLTDEQISEKQDQVKELSEKITLKSLERENAGNKRDWLKRENELAKNESCARVSYEEAEAVLASKEYKEECQFAEQWNRTIEARKWFDDSVKAGKEAERYKTELHKQKERFQEVIDGFDFAQKEAKECQSGLMEISSYIKDNASKKDCFENVQTIIGHLETVISKRAKTDQLIQRISNDQKLQDKLIAERDSLLDQYNKEEQSKEKIKKEIEEKETILNALNITELRKGLDSAKELIRNVESAIEDMKAIATAREAYDKETARLIDVEKEIEAKKKKLTEILLPQYEQAKEQKGIAEGARDLLRNSIDKYAKQMRSHLLVGCECPVCRQRINSLPDESEIDHLYQDAENLFNKRKTDFDKAEAAKNQAESIIKTESTRLEEDKARHSADKSVSLSEDRARQACLKCGISSIGCDTIQQLPDLLSKQKGHIELVLMPKIKEAEATEMVLRNLRTELKNNEEIFEKKRKEYETAKQKVVDIMSRIGNNTNNAEELKKEIEKASQNIKPLVGNTKWKHDWTLEPELFKDMLNKEAEEYSRNLRLSEDLRKKIELMEETNRKICKIISQIIEKKPSWKGLIAVSTKKDNLFGMANDVLVNMSTVMQALEKAEDQAQENEKSLETFFEANPDLSKERLEMLNRTTSITSLATSLEAKRLGPEQKKVLWEKAAQEHSKHLESKPSLEEGDTIEAMEVLYSNADATINNLNQGIGILRKELEEDAKKKKGNALLKGKADQAKNEYQRWQRLNALFGDKEGKTFRTIAQSYIFDSLLHSANEYLQKLEPRYSLKTVPGTLFSALEDAHQGYASRDTGSLSGGESFLVSLALALALSDIGQGLSVDTLFIDEGFGSLSGTPLANAINTLRSLRGQNGRHVGIISHIQEVRDNIPVQIQVNKTSDGSSSTVSVIQ